MTTAAASTATFATMREIADRSPCPRAAVELAVHRVAKRPLEDLPRPRPHPQFLPAATLPMLFRWEHMESFCAFDIRRRLAGVGAKHVAWATQRPRSSAARLQVHICSGMSVKSRDP